ncbi:MAG: PDZ domain-containing protein, partial [Planctomycetota bacterium]
MTSRTSTYGYLRFPTIRDQKIVFVYDDNLWSASTEGGVARRLTSYIGEPLRPSLSPDGKTIAFIGKVHGSLDIYSIPVDGGDPERLTYLGKQFSTVGWMPDGKSLFFASNAKQPIARIFELYELNLSDRTLQKIPIGPAMRFAVGPKKGQMLIGRNTLEPARWKRYRGGTAGDIWIDTKGEGNFKRLLQLEGNFSSPLWISDRIYFISDHEGIGNLYSCNLTGSDVKRHTHFEDFYIRNASTDGKQVVFHAGADIYLYSLAKGTIQKLEIETPSERPQRQEKYVSSARYLENYALHPKGHSLALNNRGKLFTMGHWEGPVFQYGKLQGTRYRLSVWNHSGKNIIATSDESGEERLVLFNESGEEDARSLEKLDVGRALEIKPSPAKDLIALNNHRHELVLVNVTEKTAEVIDRSPARHIEGFDWSPDGCWITYSFAETPISSIIKVYHLPTKKSYALTEKVLRDIKPVFDPEGNYIYFLSYRVFDPVYDNMNFDLGFPKGMKPYLVCLRKDTLNPFMLQPRSLSGKEGKEEEKEKKKKKRNKTAWVKIDFDGIQDRLLPFPVPEGKYGQILATKNKVLFSSFPVEGSLDQHWFTAGTPPAKGKIEIYDIKENKKSVRVEGITNFSIGPDGETLVYQSGQRLRVTEVDGKKENGSAPDKTSFSRESGYIDMGRIHLLINPLEEWKQMYREAWRLQRDHFWVEDMADLDWSSIYKRYLPLMDRIATRSEFSDLVWEMQGELGTSHAYEFGGDYAPYRFVPQGHLGCNFEYNPKTKCFHIQNIVRGESAVEDHSSPLLQPGVQISEGDTLLSINAQDVSFQRTPEELLFHQAGVEVSLRIGDAQGKKPRSVIIKTLKDDTACRYRNWVQKNREHVNKITKGQVGYIHIPDMGPHGFAEFHRAYFIEVEKPALLIDVRFNGGGHVSQLLLEKLLRRRIGYGTQRWGQTEPYPLDSLLGPMIAITNEHAGSDGDIFSHSFKLMKLGKLIGKRTWGGVIGIWPRHSLVDG